MLKLEIKDQESTDKTLVFCVEKDPADGGIDLCVSKKGSSGGFWTICSITLDGKLFRYGYITPALGLQINNNGQIQLAT